MPEKKLNVKKFRRKVERLKNVEIEERQREALLENAIYASQVSELEGSHSSLIRSKMIEMKKTEDKDKDKIALIDTQLKAIEEEINRISDLREKNTEMVKVFQAVLESRINGKRDKSRTILSWITGVGTTGLCVASLVAGYKSDVSGVMKNKSQLALFDRALGWLKRN